MDSSTSACKVEIRDADTGHLLGSGRAPHPPTTPPRSEQDPAAWWSAFETALATASDAAGIGRPNAGLLAAISVAAQQHGLVVIDQAGEVLRPAKLWNDTQSAADAVELIESLPVGPTDWADACGSVPVASLTITKLRWLRRNEPDVFRRMASVLLPHDWLTGQMTGRTTTDRGDASGTGYWSPREERYRYDLLGLVDESTAWETLVPEVLAPAEAAGTWRGMQTLVGPGTGDNMAAALGLGLEPGDLVLSLGTSGSAFCVTNHPAADATGTVAGFADATGRYLPLVCTLNATKVTEAVIRLLGIRTDELDELVLAAPAGARGLVLVPHLDGERTPNRPGASGTLGGVRSDVTREDLARAAVEGVVCNLLASVDELARWDPRVRTGRLIVVGGGAKSRAYRHVVAELTGRPW